MITVLGAVVVLAVLAVARYGADTRFDSGPDPRDPVRPRGPQYAHTPAADLRLLAAFGRRVAAHGRAWQAYDRALRPWERERSRERV
ncbi:hypothetical protein LQ327_17150 [Actinomycetospora endophytica]|uniref:Uncharacterized protein n=1 Tax=Actinomycetospora endophytica TaxID=2291215 RepID=A0ABS8PA05_9PSEU|nr:hypothetical protein [Actinomycetospora endophytica]MCD2195096.1 hypothetical protein [Actinomycetospora endophytica]